MTIGGWIIAGLVLIGTIGMAIGVSLDNGSASEKIVVWVMAICINLVAFGGLFWYFNNTASGQRQMIDQRSNLSNGLDRVVTVYTANGDVIAQYEGQIDIEANDGGYIKFDLEGKRYMYYNCFVESIAEIE